MAEEGRLSGEAADPGDRESGGAPASFEEAMERLEQVVRELESGELSLERSITRFQEGMMLAKWCRDQLDRAEQRIEVLLQQEGGGWESRPFEPRPLEEE
ncbi:MAG: exodeoxyribonuclease VII small subunit [Kyrpidia sp.]|nr:exodeoxyribonuclease VII small subunit [Kyrpidia sp.]